MGSGRPSRGDGGNHDKHIWTRSGETREGREETSGEEGRPMIDIELIRIIVGGGGEDCKGLKINKNGGWESETDGAERGDQITRPG